MLGPAACGRAARRSGRLSLACLHSGAHRLQSRSVRTVSPALAGSAPLCPGLQADTAVRALRLGPLRAQRPAWRPHQSRRRSRGGGPAGPASNDSAAQRGHMPPVFLVGVSGAHPQAAARHCSSGLGPHARLCCAWLCCTPAAYARCGHACRWNSQRQDQPVPPHHQPHHGGEPSAALTLLTSTAALCTNLLLGPDTPPVAGLPTIGVPQHQPGLLLQGPDAPGA